MNPSLTMQRGCGGAGPLAAGDEVRIDVDLASEPGMDTGTESGSDSDDDSVTYEHIWDAVWIHPRQVDFWLPR